MSFFGPDLRNGLPIGLGSLTALARAVAAVAPPPPPATDSFFEYVTLLLHGDGTNGAQNNTFLDGSTNNFTITRNGNTTQGTFSPFSQTGWSNYFDGNGDWLNPGTNTALNPGTGDFTIECWFYSTAAIGASSIFEGTSNGLSITFTTGKVAIAQSTVAYLITDANNFPINQWVHIAASRSGTTLSLFVNGTRVGTATNSTNFVTSTENRIGRDASTGYITGYLSNLRIVKGTAVYDPTLTTLTVPTAPLTAITNTSLLTCQSNRFIDNSSNAFAITRNGDVRVEAFSPFNPSTTYSTANVGGSGYFDGTGDYLSVADNVALEPGTGDFCLEIWVYFNALTIGNIYNAQQSGPSIALNASNQIEFGQSYVSVLLTDTVAATTGQWYHVAVCRSGTTLSMFVNGSRRATATNSTNFNTTVANYIGWNGGAAYFNGYLSNLRLVKGSAVYDPTLTTLTVPTAPLTAITNTSLLLNFTNGGIFDNASQTVLETVGNAQVSTTQKKYGTGSMYFDGTGDYLIAPDRPALRFGTGDFTIEGWVYQTFVGTTRFFISKGTGTTGWSIGTTAAGGVLRFQYGLSSLVGATALVVNTWHHFAVVRYGSATGNLKIYFDGVLDATSAGAVNDNFNQTSVMYVGTDRTGIVLPTFEGYLDDLRITNGYARYTANFTPPTAAFPDN